MVDMFFYRDPEEQEKDKEEVEKVPEVAAVEWSGEEAQGEVSTARSEVSLFFRLTNSATRFFARASLEQWTGAEAAAGQADASWGAEAVAGEGDAGNWGDSTQQASGW
jgi:hypothetical protein